MKKKLTETQIEELKIIKRSGRSALVRQKAHAILLWCNGNKVAKIAFILDLTEDTVEVWIDAYKQLGNIIF